MKTMADRGRKRRKAATLPTVRVFSVPGQPARGVLVAGNLRIACSLGRSGLSRNKREGDGATPAGYHRVVLVIRRPRGMLPHLCATAIPSRALRRDDGWCEAPDSGVYNRPLRLAHRDAGDHMWRRDHLYDWVGVLDWNIRPRISRRGSAIFLHLARPGLAPTAGCIALLPGDLRRLARRIGSRTIFQVGAAGRRRVGR